MKSKNFQNTKTMLGTLIQYSGKKNDHLLRNVVIPIASVGTCVTEESKLCQKLCK